MIEGSSHSYQRALHCLADLRTSNDEMRAHWLMPYFMTAALRISSSVFFHTPPLATNLMVVALVCELLYRERARERERCDGDASSKQLSLVRYWGEVVMNGEILRLQLISSMAKS